MTLRNEIRAMAEFPVPANAVSIDIQLWIQLHRPRLRRMLPYAIFLLWQFPETTLQ